MLTEQPTKSQPKTGITQRAAAKLLGVTHWHLNRVLRGHIKSRRLTAKYNQLINQTK